MFFVVFLTLWAAFSQVFGLLLVWAYPSGWLAVVVLGVGYVGMQVTYLRGYRKEELISPALFRAGLLLTFVVLVGASIGKPTGEDRWELVRNLIATAGMLSVVAVYAVALRRGASQQAASLLQSSNR